MSHQTKFAQTEVLNMSQEILSIEIGRLHAHPANPNRLSEVRFRKLVRQIERTGQYEPLVVRRHPSRRGGFQVLNGHHRLRALKQLGCARADCVVFRADDEQALVYLATLNRICGRDNVVRKAKLIGQLCAHRNSRQLARTLPESPRAIDKLAAFAKGQALTETKAQKPMLIPMTFFVNEGDHALLCDAFDKAAGNDSGTMTQRRLRALKRMAEDFLRRP